VTALPRYVWQPGTEEIAARAGIDPAEVIRADQNTSPFTPPWASEVAARSAATVNEYPAARYRELRRAVAEHVGADENMIVPGAGADELIGLAARAFLAPGAVAVAESPTYAMYRIATLQQSAHYREVARRLPDSGFPADALAVAAREAALTWLCVPHNPIGDRPPSSDIDRVAAATRGITVIDAAYAEFAGDRWGEHVAAASDVVVLGTLSKAFALAGARVGYAVAPPDLAEILDRLRPPGSVSSVSVALALRSFAEIGWMQEHVGVVAELRTALAAGLQDLGLTPRSSATNFVLVEIGPGAADVADRLMGRGIAARSFAPEHPLADHLRFTVRRPDQQDRMLDALESEMT
jgi:histidinol-phosphate aminotransferase